MTKLLSFCLAFLLLAAPAPASDLEAYDLRVEFRKNPLGVDAEQPRLSWKLRSDVRGERQTAYRLLVATSPATLARNEGNAWDSGRVDSEETHLIPYNGAALEPGRTYFWKVRTWNGEGEPSAWSAPATWTTGRMGDWGAAQWAGLDSLTHAALEMAPDQLPLFRRAFGLEKPVRRALVHVTGLGSYVLRINGEAASEDMLMPGWTDYAKSVLYNTYDVTDLVHEGENALGIALGHGMYHVPGAPERSNAEGRYAKFYGPYGDPKLILHLTIEHPDGSATTLTSGDEGWRVAGAPTTFSSIWGGEDYDARLEQSGWATADFDDAAWAEAPVLDPPGGTLRAQPNPPLRVQAVHRPAQVTEPAPGVYVYDLGQNLSGWPRLRIRGPEGASVKLRPAEVLDDSTGLIDQRSMKHWGEIFFTYTLRGKGAETWRPSFTYTGFRYVQVEGATRDPQTAAAEGKPLFLGLESQFVHADAAPTGSFASSDTLLNGIHEIITDAIRSNMMSVMTDCPHREKLGWLEQAYLNGPGVMHNFDTATLYAKWTDDMAEAQLPPGDSLAGLVPDIAPEFTVFSDGFRDSPEWGSAFILAPWMAYRHFGDARPLRRHYPAMKRYAEYLEGKRGEDGILAYGLGDWYDIAPGPPGPSKLTSKGVTATATYFSDLRTLAEIARLLGEEEDAQRFEARAAEVRAAFNAAYFNEETALYDEGSQTAQAMPLALGLAPPKREDEVFAHLVEDIRAHGTHTTAGDVGHRYVLLALMRRGRSDLIHAMATNPEPPSYAAQRLAGSTTLTEAWDANPLSSQNHFMLGHIEEWFYAGLGGLRVEAPGFRRVTIRPTVTEALEWAEVEYESVRGPIRSAWRRDGEALRMSVDVPPGVTAEVHVPAASAEAVQEDGAPAQDAEGVTLLRMEEGRAVFEVGGGAYRFAVEEMTGAR